jgi:PTS system mannose-specific IIC component
VLDGPLPLLILFIAGAPVVEAINNVIPSWLLAGFKNAGNMLPAIGFAILLRSMNLKGNFQYLLIGFVLYAYFSIGALGAALIGIALAMISYYNNQKIADMQNMGGVDDE